MKDHPSRRQVLARLAGLALIATPLAPAGAQATGYHRPARYLQVYSFRWKHEALSKAWALRRLGFDHAAVFCASNGFYAVTAGRVPAGQDYLVEQLKRQGRIPADSFLTSGRAYVAEVPLGAHPPRPRPTPQPRYRPSWQGSRHGGGHWHGS